MKENVLEDGQVHCLVCGYPADRVERRNGRVYWWHGRRMYPCGMKDVSVPVLDEVTS